MAVSRAPDIGRMARAMQRPGIDPRTWVSLATVQEVDWDDDNGPLATVFLMPTGTQETARLSTLYAGPGFGLYVPVEVGDDVVVVAPDGDPDNGLVITAGLHSPSASVPTEAGDNRDDFVLVVKEGQACRIFTKTSDGTGGDFTVTAEGKIVLTSGTVLLGGSTAVEQVILGTTYRAADATFDGALTGAATAYATAEALVQVAFAPALSAFNALPPTTPMTAGTLKALIDGLAATTALGTTFNAAVGSASTAKEAGAAGYLSRVSKTL